jgi:hypothetical protein
MSRNVATVLTGVGRAVTGLARVDRVRVRVGVLVTSDFLAVFADVGVELVGSLKFGVQFLAFGRGGSLMGLSLGGQTLRLRSLGVGFGLSPAGVGGMFLGDGLALADTRYPLGRLLSDLAGLNPATFLVLARQQQRKRYQGKNNHYGYHDPYDGIHIDS